MLPGLKSNPVPKPSATSGMFLHMDDLEPDIRGTLNPGSGSFQDQGLE